MKKKITRWLKKHWKDAFIDGLIGLVVLVMVLTGALFIWVSTLDIPDLSSFDQRKILQSTKIYDRTGEVLLYDLHQDVKRTIVPYEDISYYIKNATVAIEDDQFYQHWGVDIRAIFRAAITNLTQGDLLGGQGGSTITQQVIKNSVLQNEKKLTRKIKEAILAIRLEQVLSKDEILGHYLNESPYGGTIYGIEEASQAYFGKHAKDVSLTEAAYLAAIPQSPTYLSPYGNHRDALDKRARLVLKRMQVNGFITQEEYDQAVNVEVEFQPQVVSGIRAPHFVMYIKEQLVEMYGEDALSEKGLRVITTLDWEMQQQAEEIVKRKALENTSKYNASNAGLVAINPQDGDVLTMVGSRDYFDEEIDGNYNVTLANRQPGSSIKPIVYASAFSKGYNPSTVLYDVKTQFGANCAADDQSSESPCYSPSNYNHKFKGPISMRNALAQSLNIPAVKTLYLTGLRDAIRLAGDMGISTLNDPDRLGLTLVLGGGEVKLLEHTGAYGVLANEGIKADRRTILRVEDTQGNVIDTFEPKTHRVLDRQVALEVSDILSDDEARSPLWGHHSIVWFQDRDVAVKSGSTNNLVDAWIMGYTPDLAVGVWVGNNDNAPMGGGLSGLIATPMWREFMNIALPLVEPQEFSEPDPIPSDIKPILRGSVVDASTIISDVKKNKGSEVDINDLSAGIHNILHFVNKSDPLGEYPTNPQSDPQYNNWEYAVQKWRLENFTSMLNNQTNEPVVQ